MAFDRLLFGTAGVPNSTAKKNNPVEGVKRIHELGLDCMQLEFAHGVRIPAWAVRARPASASTSPSTSHSVVSITRW